MSSCWLLVTSYQIKLITNPLILYDMRLAKKSNTIHYVPQEIRETTLTEVTYFPLTREMLERYFQHPIKEAKHKLVKKRRK